MPIQSFTPDSFQTFGDLLKYLRRRERLTQLELSIAVGYSEAQISRLEQNQRLPDLAALKALFVPALHIENESEMIARFLDLAQSARQEDAPTPGIAPYKGLLFFDESDADLFFGRENLTAYLTDRVTDLASDASTRFLAVVGASGSGKSSLVRAGLAVALKRTGWTLRVFTPTAEPLKMLETQLNSKHAKVKSERVLILVDQFEETFTLCHDEAERIAFIEKLLELTQDASRKITVVIALRADFYSHCAQYPALRQAVAAEQEYIGQMTTEELRRAIEEPAKHGGWDFESGLVDLLLQDIGADGMGQPEPGALPLLSHALLATWERRRGKTFTLDGYRASGGVRSAIAETAESVFTDQLNQGQQELARDVFLRLTELGEGTEDTRRRAALNELVRQSEEATQLRTVLNTLAEARLIILNEDSAEVAHEALIREWQRLHEWLTNDREGLRLHRHLTESVREWEARGHDISELYRGARLAQAREWASANEERLNESEFAFLEASINQEQHDALEREAQRQRELEAAQKLAETQKQAAGRLWRLSIILLGSLVFAMILAGFALQSNRLATSRELAAASVVNLNVDPELSILLALNALSSSTTAEAEHALHSAVWASRLVQRINTGENLYSIAYAPEGTRLVTAGQDGVAKVWDLATDKSLLELKGHTGAINEVIFSPDGKRIATAGDDRTARVWNAITGELLFTLRGHMAPVTGLAISPNGEEIATVSEDTTLRIWNATTGSVIFVGPDPNLQPIRMTSVVFSPDGKTLATGSEEGIIGIWDAEKQQAVNALFDPDLNSISSLAFSPDGKTLASTGGSFIRLWDIESGELALTLLGHTNIVFDVKFSPDGSKLATAGLDRKIHVWDSSTGQIVLTFSGSQAEVNAIGFSPDGLFLASTSNDASIRIWDLGPAREVYTLETRDAWARIALSNDGTLIAEGVGPSIKVWGVETGQEQYVLSQTSLINGVAFHPNGLSLASTDADGNVKIWDLTTQEVRLTLSGHTASTNAVAFSPDGEKLASGGEDNIARIWDTGSGDLLFSLHGHAGPITSVIFSPDSSMVVTGGVDNIAILWNANTGARIRTLQGHIDVVWGVGFSPNGERIVTASRDATVRIWDVGTGNVLLTLTGHTGTVVTAVFSPDGKKIASSSRDGTTKLWDAYSGELLLNLFGDGSGGGGVGITSDGTRLLTAGENGVHLYLLNLPELINLAKSRLTRDFTKQECWTYLHRRTCPTPSSSMIVNPLTK